MDTQHAASTEVKNQGVETEPHPRTHEHPEPEGGFRPQGVILVVEDDRGDQLLTCEALANSTLETKIVVVSDGEEALDYLHRRGKYGDVRLSPRPDLILLDLNMPRVNGRQLAQKLKADPDLRIVPIVVLSTSDYSEDVSECYHAGVNSYVHKPTDFDHFVETLKEIESYWLRVVEPAPRL